GFSSSSTQAPYLAMMPSRSNSASADHLASLKQHSNKSCMAFSFKIAVSEVACACRRQRGCLSIRPDTLSHLDTCGRASTFSSRLYSRLTCSTPNGGQAPSWDDRTSIGSVVARAILLAHS